MEMKKLPMCRICLVENVRMVVFAYTNLQEIYEKLTDIPLLTEDSRPTLACFICHDKLKQCHQLQKQCLEAEERFAQMLKEDFETKPQINRGQLEFSEYGGTPTQHISVFDDCHTASAVIKEESPADCEGQEGKQHTEDEGDSEDDLPLMEYKIEIKEEEVSAEKRQLKEIKKLELENVDNSYADVKDTPAHHSESDSDDEPVMEIKTEVEDEQESIGAAVVEKQKQDMRRSKLEDISALLKKKKNSQKLIFASKITQKTQNRTSNLVNKFKEPIAASKQGVNRINKTTLVTSSRNNSNKDDIRGNTSNEGNDYLNRHLRVCVKDKRFKCDICQSSFTKQAYLTAHIRSHTGEKPYKCPICQRSFTQKSSLICHIRIHTVEKPFKCDICPHSFSRNSVLKRHIRTHTGEKPFKCDICQRSFTQKTHLTSHIRVHTGEKPFKCDICQRNFTQKSSLRCHIRKTCEKPPR